MSTDQQRLTEAEILARQGHAVIATDVEGTVQYWNAAAEELLGWSAEETRGRFLGDMALPAAAWQPDAALRDSDSSGRWSASCPVRRKDGGTFTAVLHSQALFRGRDLVGVVIVTTSLGCALRPLLERASEPALIFGADAVVTFLNSAATQLFAWARSATGRSLVPLLHPEDRSTLAAALEQAVKQAGAHPPVEVRLGSDPADAVWCEASLTNMLEDPEVRGVVCFLRRSRWREAYQAAQTEVRQLRTALESRIIIEQAKGVLVGRHGLQPNAAFERLRTYSRSRNLRIHDVCHRIVAGELDLRD